MAGYWNVDVVEVPGVDQVLDLEREHAHVQLAGGDYKEIMLSHVIEHIKRPLVFMENLYKVAAVDATLTIRCPYGSSDDADEDPTHVRRMFLQSFGYYSQPFFWRADYGYRGDWQPESITLWVAHEYRHMPEGELWDMITHQRNVVTEMVCVLKAVKPMREPLRELQVHPRYIIGRPE